MVSTGAQITSVEPTGHLRFKESAILFVLDLPVGVRIAQSVQHGTDHRSQVCTALTSFGIEPPDIDVWAYARASRREWTEPVTDAAVPQSEQSAPE